MVSSGGMLPRLRAGRGLPRRRRRSCRRRWPRRRSRARGRSL